MANTRPCRTFHSHLVNWTFQPFYYLMLCFALLLPLTFPLCLSLVVVCLGGKRICCCGKFFAKAECENVDVGGGMDVCAHDYGVSGCLSVSLSSRLRLWHTLRMSNASNFNAISMRCCVCCCCCCCSESWVSAGVCGFAHSVTVCVCV